MTEGGFDDFEMKNINEDRRTEEDYEVNNEEDERMIEETSFNNDDYATLT